MRPPKPGRRRRPNCSVRTGCRPALPCRSFRRPRRKRPVAGCDRARSERFPAIADSPVPVLLPYALGDDTHDRAADDLNPIESYLSDFEPTKFFQAGPTGYDATFVLRIAQTCPAFSDIEFRDPVVVQISAFNLLYQLPEAKGAKLSTAGRHRERLSRHPPPDSGTHTALQFRALRHSLCGVDPVFRRAAAPHAASPAAMPIGSRCVSCARSGWSAATRPSRRDSTAGALPNDHATQSDAFHYHPVGTLVPGTRHARAAGNPDGTVYARIRFPAAEAPGLCQYASLPAARRPRDRLGCRSRPTTMATTSGRNLQDMSGATISANGATSRSVNVRPAAVIRDRTFSASPANRARANATAPPTAMPLSPRAKA